MKGRCEMKVRDLLEVEDVSMDVYDDYDERCGIAYESGYVLTDAGRERFAAALDIPILMIRDGTIVLHCEGAKQAQACKELFYSMAGYCGVTDFDKWFRDR